MQLQVGWIDIRTGSLLSCFLVVLMWINPAGSEEYCNSDTFSPSCGSDEVVFIEKAEFGRMQYNTCSVTKTPVGCSADAISVLDSKCSGRRRCDVRVADSALEEVNKCGKDFKSYLDVEHKCLKVIHVVVYSTTTIQCQLAAHVDMTERTSGYLPYILAEESDCVTENGPWVLEAQPGQTFNFTLYDFTWNPAYNQPRCTNILAVITEPLVNHREEVCGRNSQRLSHVMRTVSHKVEIRIFKRNIQENKSYFLLHFQVLGCPDPQLGIGKIFERTADTALVSCVGQNQRQWTLRCEGGQWVGQHDNCTNTAAVIGATGSKRDDWMPFPLDVSLALVAGVAFVVGCCIFVVGIFILKRNSLNAERKRRNNILLREAQDITFGKYPSHPDPSHPEFKIHPASSGEGRSAQNQPIENEYAYVTDFPPPPSPKTLRMCASGKQPSVRTRQTSKKLKQPQSNITKDCYQMRQLEPRPNIVTEPYFDLDHSTAERRNSS